MTQETNYTDGAANMVNMLANTRNSLYTNTEVAVKMSAGEMRQWYINGLFSKIIRIIVNYSLQDAFTFENEEDEKYYNEVLAPIVAKACSYQLGFGRGAVLIFRRENDVLSNPLPAGSIGKRLAKFRVFSGDEVSAMAQTMSITSPRYDEPYSYTMSSASGVSWTRVVDFTYLEPSHNDLSTYDYGGVSLAQMVRDDLVSLGIVKKANASIIEKMSTLFYKMEGFDSRMELGQEGEVLKFMALLESARSIYGAGVVDKNTDVTVTNQTLSGIKDIYDIAIESLAATTGIPVPMLVGQPVKGLNSAGDTEKQVFNDNMDAHLKNYIYPNVCRLGRILGMGKITLKESNNLNATEQVAYEKTVLGNAELLMRVGGDQYSYLVEKDMVKEKPLFDFTKETEEEQEVDPAAALNGAQVKSMYDIIVGVGSGEIPKSTGSEMLTQAFPIGKQEADKLLADVVPGSIQPSEGGAK